MSIETFVKPEIPKLEKEVREIIKEGGFVVGDFLFDGDGWRYSLLINSYRNLQNQIVFEKLCRLMYT